MIYYSHINEDNRIERQLLRESVCSVVVAVCGSGERVLALMDNVACKKFVVVDANEQAIFLTQLKLAALTHLTIQEYLQFIGHNPSAKKDRLILYDELKYLLPSKALTFWNNRRGMIANGILNSGHFEKFLHRVKPLLVFFLGREFQQVFNGSYQEHTFPEKRWKLLRKLFSYTIVYKLAGNKDVAFIGRNAQTPHIPEALDKTIRKHKASSSFMAHLIFKGDLLQMREEDLPPSLQKDVLSGIKQRLVQKGVEVEYHPIDLLKYMESKAAIAEEAVFYSLSDILSFEDINYLHKLICRMAFSANIIVGRSFLRNRLSNSQQLELRAYGQVFLHDEQESTGMYQVFSIKA